MLTLLLAPLSGVLAGTCYCPHGAASELEIAPGFCCEDMKPCCYEYNEPNVTTSLVTDLNQQSRADLKVGIRQSLQLLPAPAPVVAREQKMIHCADPPDTSVRELSFRQSWLI